MAIAIVLSKHGQQRLYEPSGVSIVRLSEHDDCVIFMVDLQAAILLRVGKNLLIAFSHSEQFLLQDYFDNQQHSVFIAQQIFYPEDFSSQQLIPMGDFCRDMVGLASFLDDVMDSLNVSEAFDAENNQVNLMELETFSQQVNQHNDEDDLQALSVANPVMEKAKSYAGITPGGFVDMAQFHPVLARQTIQITNKQSSDKGVRLTDINPKLFEFRGEQVYLDLVDTKVEHLAVNLWLKDVLSVLETKQTLVLRGCGDHKIISHETWIKYSHRELDGKKYHEYFLDDAHLLVEFDIDQKDVLKTFA